MKKGSPKKAVLAPKIEEEQILRLAARIKFLRESKGYSSYEKFAFEHDIPRAQFGRYEKGEDLRFSSLVRVLNALDISFQEFFSEGFD
jgi:transcriptional regulator with XRE-family HTH domain